MFNSVLICIKTLVLCFVMLANDCGPLPVPMNGTLIGNLTTYPNKVNFTCDEGFVLQGSAIRQCLPDKRWAGNDTFCKGMLCLKVSIRCSFV